MTTNHLSSKFVAPLLNRLVTGQRLDSLENQRVFTEMLNGTLSDAQVASFLTAWRVIGEQRGELTAGASAMRDRAIRLSIPPHLRPLSDNCGTGGDGASTFNISTASAIVAASCGVHLAKHGNRSVSSQCGSADLLFKVGFPEDLGPDQAVELLEKTGFTFFFAPGFHPALRPIMPVRKSLGIRTIFNLLGPLANPVRPEIQLVGVGDRSYLRPVAESLRDLGVVRALVVHSRDGLDEISPCALTDCQMVDDGGIKSFSIDPTEHNIAARMEDLRGGDSDHNASLLWELLDAGSNPKSDAIADAVVMNAGAMIWLNQKAESFAVGMSLARSQLKNKLARDYFKGWLSTARALHAAAGSP